MRYFADSGSAGRFYYDAEDWTDVLLSFGTLRRMLIGLVKLKAIQEYAASFETVNIAVIEDYNRIKSEILDVYRRKIEGRRDFSAYNPFPLALSAVSADDLRKAYAENGIYTFARICTHLSKRKTQDKRRYEVGSAMTIRS